MIRYDAYRARFTMRRSGVPASTNNPVAIVRHSRIGDSARVLRRAPRLTALLVLSLLLSRANAYTDTKQTIRPAVKITSGRALQARYVPALKQASLTYRVPYRLLVALIDQETNGTWRASSVTKEPNGTVSVGLAQANSAYLAYYAWRFGLLDPTDGVQSIWFAARYLRHLLDTGAGTWYGANVAYKRGPNVKGAPSFKLAAIASAICLQGGVTE
jgi:hypothetical protein